MKKRITYYREDVGIIRLAVDNFTLEREVNGKFHTCYLLTKSQTDRVRKWGGMPAAPYLGRLSGIDTWGIPVDWCEDGWAGILK
jgi:hypothetical protein